MKNGLAICGKADHIPRTLIVDDSALFLSCLNRLLKIQGIAQVVGTANDGHQAIEMAGKLRPDLVLMDLHMPGLDGMETAQQLREQVPESRIIIMTADGSGKMATHCRSHGIHGFVSKHNLLNALDSEIRRIFPRPSRAVALLTAGIAAFCMTLWSPLAAPLHAASVELTWAAPTQASGLTPFANLSGYRLYHGTTPGVYSSMIDVGLNVTATLTNLEAGTPHYFAVSACNEFGLEGTLSEEVTWTAPAPKPLDHFAWGVMTSPKTAGVPFEVSILAQDSANLPASGFSGTASLTAMISKNVTIGTGTGSSAFPLTTSSDKARTQVIYLADEVGPAGWISGLTLNVQAVPGLALQNWTLRLKHTPLGSYPSKAAWESNGWAVVHQSQQTIASTGPVYFAFSTPFYFNGTNNLLVDFSFSNTNHTTTGYCQYTTVSGKRTLYAKVNGTTYGDPLTWTKTSPRPNLSSTIPNAIFQFNTPFMLTPDHTTPFVNGRWTGSLTISEPAKGIILNATDDTGHQGSSLPFEVASASGATGDTMAGVPAEPSATSASYDFDDDGMQDAQELFAGTDPYDPESVLSVSVVPAATDLGGMGYTVQWSSAAGRHYTVMRSTDLTATPAFTPLASHIEGQADVTIYTDTDPTDSRTRFYQVVVEP